MTRVLLDNCVPRRLAKTIHGHAVVHAQDIGWERLSDGDLLEAAAEQFDAIVTVDKNLRHQQVLIGRPFALIVLGGKDTKIKDLLPLVPALLAALQFIQPGDIREITAP